LKRESSRSLPRLLKSGFPHRGDLALKSPVIISMFGCKSKIFWRGCLKLLEESGGMYIEEIRIFLLAKKM